MYNSYDIESDKMRFFYVLANVFIFIFSILIIRTNANAQSILSSEHLQATEAYQKNNFYDAAKLLPKFVEQGDSEAQYCLARMYENGWGVERDLYTARTLYNKASKQGHKLAKDRLNDIDLSIVNYNKEISMAKSTIFAKNPEDAKQKLERKGINYTADNFIKSAENGEKEIVMLFIISGMNINAKGSGGETALIASLRKEHTEIAKTLLAKSANINDKAHNGSTPLIISSMKGYTEIVKILLTKGVDVNAVRNDGINALMVASDNGHLEIVQLLLEKGAKIDAQNKDLITPLMFASTNGHDKILTLLLERGANINNKNNDGLTALMCASSQDHINTVKILLANGADVNEKTNDGATALTYATLKNYVEIVKILLENNADVDAKMANGLTALIFASNNGNIAIVKALLSSHANVNEEANDGTTAISLALKKGHKEIVQALIAEGAITTKNSVASPQKYDPACAGKDNNICSAIKFLLNSEDKLCYRLMAIELLNDNTYRATCELASFDRSTVTYILKK